MNEFDKCVCVSVFFSDLCVECEELIEGGIVNDFEVESKLLFDYGVHHYITIGNCNLFIVFLFWLWCGVFVCSGNDKYKCTNLMC